MVISVFDTEIMPIIISNVKSRLFPQLEEIIRIWEVIFTEQLAV